MLRRALIVTGGFAVGLALVAALLVVVVLATAPGHAVARRLALSALTRAVDGRVEIGSVSGSLWRAADLKDVTLSTPDGRPVIRVGRVRVSYVLANLLRGRYALSHVVIERPTVVLQEGADGHLNIEHLFRLLERRPPGGKRARVELNDVRLTDGTVILREQALPGDDPPERRFTAINLDASHLRVSHPDSVGLVADLRHLAVTVSDPAVRLKDAAGRVVIEGDSVRFDLARVELPGTSGRGRGVVRWGRGAPRGRAKVEAALDLPRVAFADFRWAVPGLPEQGGGRTAVRLRLLAGGGSDWSFRDAELSSGRSRLGGSAALVVGPRGGATFDSLAVDAEPLDLALLTPFLGRPPVAGTVRGRIHATGTLASLEVTTDLALTDEGVAARPVSRADRLGPGDRGRERRYRLPPVLPDLRRHRARDDREARALRHPAGSARAERHARRSVARRRVRRHAAARRRRRPGVVGARHGGAHAGRHGARRGRSGRGLAVARRPAALLPGDPGRRRAGRLREGARPRHGARDRRGAGRSGRRLHRARRGGRARLRGGDRAAGHARFPRSRRPVRRRSRDPPVGRMARRSRAAVGGHGGRAEREAHGDAGGEPLRRRGARARRSERRAHAGAAGGGHAVRRAARAQSGGLRSVGPAGRAGRRAVVRAPRRHPRGAGARLLVGARRRRRGLRRAAAGRAGRRPGRRAPDGHAGELGGDGRSPRGSRGLRQPGGAERARGRGAAQRFARARLRAARLRGLAPGREPALLGRRARRQRAPGQPPGPCVRRLRAGLFRAARPRARCGLDRLACAPRGGERRAPRAGLDPGGPAAPRRRARRRRHRHARVPGAGRRPRAPGRPLPARGPGRRPAHGGQRAARGPVRARGVGHDGRGRPAERDGPPHGGGRRSGDPRVGARRGRPLRRLPRAAARRRGRLRGAAARLPGRPAQRARAGADRHRHPAARSLPRNRWRGASSPTRF